jgi:hypothetical protein
VFTSSEAFSLAKDHPIDTMIAAVGRERLHIITTRDPWHG